MSGSTFGSFFWSLPLRFDGDSGLEGRLRVAVFCFIFRSRSSRSMLSDGMTAIEGVGLTVAVGIGPLGDVTGPVANDGMTPVCVVMETPWRDAPDGMMATGSGGRGCGGGEDD